MFRPKKGRLEVIAGCMFSGKSRELILRVDRAVRGRKHVQVFKPIIDDRYHATRVTAHNGDDWEAIPVLDSVQLLECVQNDTQLVAVDEGQFFDSGLLKVVRILLDRGTRVIVAGLDTDFRGEPFGPMPYLLAEADVVTKQQAVCLVCGEDANRTQRIVNGVPANYYDPIIMVGASESYEARCRDCHEVPGRPY